MGETTGIAWTDHTFNPWWGCTRVSPGCEHCYAETLATVRRKLPVWGVDAGRKAMSTAYWKQPARWNKAAAAAGERRRVFCASMADVFEVAPDRNFAAKEVMRVGRLSLWPLIEETPHLDWLLLTKRPQNVAKLVPPGWMSSGFPHNVWLGVTAENQEHYEKRWPILANLPAQVRFISHEPALGPLDIKPSLFFETERLLFPDWVITGGESGPGARPYNPTWARDVVTQCGLHGVAAFVKQMGSNVIDFSGRMKDRKGGDPSEWPECIRVQEFPR